MRSSPAAAKRPSAKRPRSWTSGSRSARSSRQSWWPKYLACRESPAKRKLFRQTRKALAQASTYAQKRMIDAKGVLNPGLMPQRLEDLHLLAPPRDDVDDVLVERWNRVTEVWRNEVEFRTAVLRYATSKAHRDPASAALWPEVVYPLIERARWHRRIRPRTEAVWDYVCGQLRVPDAGVRLDRALHRSVPAPLVARARRRDAICSPITPARQMSIPIHSPRSSRPGGPTGRLAHRQPRRSGEPGRRAGRARKGKDLLQLADPDPLRFSQGAAPRTVEGGARGSSKPGPGPAGCQAGQPSPCPGRPVPTDRHPLASRPGRRSDRHPGHDQ